MMRRTPARLAMEPFKTDPNYVTKFQWGPDIRMLDKDEKIPEATLEAKLRKTTQYGGADMSAQFPHMDPLNPTWEQKRASNTANVTAFPFADYWKGQHHYGFRSVPPEMVDWRSTMYGDLFEELPYANEKLAFAHPDYTLAGLVYTAEEQVRISDTVPRTVDKSSFGMLMSPKVDHWIRWIAARDDRERKVSATKILIFFITMFVCYMYVKKTMQGYETQRRRERTWWDGANAGTWKYGNQRAHFLGQGATGGSIIPILGY